MSVRLDMYGDRVGVYAELYYAKKVEFAVDAEIAQLVRKAVVEELQKSEAFQKAIRDLAVAKIVKLLEQQ